MHVPDFLYRTARLAGDVEAVRDDRQRRTYAELLERAGCIATGLSRIGVRPGDRVAVLASNRVELVELCFASTLLGSVLVPIRAGRGAAEVAFQLEDAEPRAIVVEDGLRDLVERPPSEPDEPLWVRVPEASADRLQGWTNYEDLVADAPIPRRDAAPDEVCLLMYTGEATGAPKGALLTHRNVVAMVLAWLYEIRLKQAPDRLLPTTSLLEIVGLLHALSAIAAGAHLLLVNESRTQALLDTLSSEHVTHALFGPATLERFVKQQQGFTAARPDLRRIVCIGASLPPSILERARELFGCELVRGYGVTETTGVITVLRPTDLGASGAEVARQASVGRAVLTCAVRVVDERGVDVETGAVGRLVVRGEQVAHSYWQRSGAPLAAAPDGWFRTGDRATMDPDGYVTIVERAG